MFFIAQRARVSQELLEWFAADVNTETAPAEAGAASVLSQHSARPDGIEPLTFCFGDSPRNDAEFWTTERALILADLSRQVQPDAEIAPLVGVE